MYPIFRMGYQLFRHRNDAALDLFDTHESHHICWPWDLDIWWELNNGRALTLFDLGRIPWAERIGIADVLKDRRWGITVAGSTTRYRARVRAFDRITMKTRALGWDTRFFYSEQSMWRPDGACANHVLIRSAVTDGKGIVAPQQLADLMGVTVPSPALPQWVQSWIAAETQRPWPPMADA